MNAVLAMLAGMLIAAGILLTIHTLRPRPARVRRVRTPIRWPRVSRRTAVTLGAGAAAGVLAAVLSGVAVLAVVVPVAVVGLPRIVGKQDRLERDLLGALESWARSLAAASATGRLTLRDTIEVTRTAAPTPIRPQVDRLATRMAGGWPARDALQVFADEVGDAWGDEVVIYLIQAADYSAAGLAQALQSIAGLLAQQLTLRGAVFTERERPRRVIIQIACIAGGLLALVTVFARTPSLAAYSTPLGQALLTVVLAGLAGLLFWARWIGRPQSDARYLITRTDGADR